jgi:hypothetical protein
MSALATGTNVGGSVVDKIWPLTSSAGHVAVDLAVGNAFSFTTDGNFQLDNPTNMPASGFMQQWAVVITQGATPRALALGSYYVPDQNFFALDQAVGAINTLNCLSIGPTYIKCFMS